MAEAPSPSEPAPRTHHATVAIDNKAFLWGGNLNGQHRRQQLGSTDSGIDSTSPSSHGGITSVDVFQVGEEKWEKQVATGVGPPDLSGCAYAASETSAYSFGGLCSDGRTFVNTLYELNSKLMEWTELKALNPERAPRAKVGSGMVAVNDQLVVFAGCFIDNECTDEFHVFHVPTRTWSCPPTTGTKPPACAYFSFTQVTPTKVVMVGGATGRRRMDDMYILNLINRHWTKVRSRSRPEARSHHAACCICGPLCSEQPEHPLLVLMGGIDNQGRVLSDMWMLEHIDNGIWKKVRFPLQVARYGHTATAFGHGPGFRQVLLFGGRSEWRGGLLADSTLLTLERNYGDWEVVGESCSSELGAPEERIRRKIERLLPPLDRPQTAPLPPSSRRNTKEEAEDVRAATEKLNLEKKVLQAEDSARRAERRALKAEEESSRAKAAVSKLERLHQTDQRLWAVERSEISLSSTMLGSGAWGKVWLADFRGSPVAAKCLHDIIAAPHNEALFVREMNIAARMHHQNIVQFIGATLEGEMIILTELMTTSLRKLMEKRSIEKHSLFTAEVTSISLDVARALNYLHLVKPDPIIHRDISSANVLLEPASGTSWRAKLSDFGSANFLRRLNTAGPGNPNYAAPEATIPAQQSPKMDVYSFGVLLLEMCSGSMIPADSTSRVAAIRRISQPVLQGFIKHCMAVDAQARPDTSTIVMQLLQDQPTELLPRKTLPVAVNYLRGVDVIAETTFDVTNQAQLYEWRGHGIKIHFQQDCLPTGCSSCRIKIVTSLSGQYSLPSGYELVSGVYWIHCPAKLSKHATMELQHCSTQRERLSFVRAECTQEQLPYVFKNVDGGVFSEHSTHGSVTLSRFSGWGIGWLKSPRAHKSDSQQYSAQVYYANDIPNTWRVLFTVKRNPNLDLEETAFRKRLEEVTMQKTSKTGPPFPVEFSADNIELEIPEPPSGWRMFCLSHPAIPRKTVDRFRARPGEHIPHCQIRVLPCAETPVGSSLEKRIGLKGAKEPFNYFLMECGPVTEAGAAPQQQSVGPYMEGRPTVQERERGLSIRNLTSALDEVNNWEELGVKLDVKWSKIKEIEREPNRSVRLCKADLLDYWLNSDLEASWEKVASALEEMGILTIARGIRSTYCRS